jgi:hypothetical protein
MGMAPHVTPLTALAKEFQQAVHERTVPPLVVYGDAHDVAPVVPGQTQHQRDAILLSVGGFSELEVARQLGSNEDRIHEVLANPTVKAHVQARRRAAMSKLLEGQLGIRESFEAAVGRLNKLLQSPDEKVALGAVKLVLDANKDFPLVDFNEQREGSGVSALRASSRLALDDSDLNNQKGCSDETVLD